MRRSLTGLTVVLLTAIALLASAKVAHGDSSIPVVDRRLFFSGSPDQPQSLSLTPLRPSGSTTASNLTKSELKFEYQAFIQTNTVTVSSPMSFSLWLNSTSAKDVTVSVTGALHEKLSGGTDLPLTNSTLSLTISPGQARPYSLNFTQQDQSVSVYSTVSVGVRIAPVSKTNVTLFWGSSSTSSYTVLRLSGYEYLSPNGPFEVLDSSQHSSSSFDLNATFPNNIVYFKASVFSAFGFQDIGNVNLTLVDPLSHSVKREPMTPLSGPTQPQPYVYTASWAYSSNATSGAYLVSILIIDAQNSTAFKFSGVATFGLSRASLFSRPPFNLLPYFGLGGGALVVGAVYYRRRKTKKSYLVPFDYFSTLTGGGLDGGTVVTVEGNTGSGKTILTEQLMFEDLRNGKPCVFVATSDFPANIRASMKTMGLDVSGYEQNGLLTFVDGYSSEAGQQSTEKFSIPSLGDLTTLGMKISSSLPSESKGGSLYFDSLTPLASKTKPESLVSFVQSVGARVRGMGGKALFTVGPSVDGMVQKQLEEMADCVVQMEAFEESGVRKSRLRIAKFRARRHQQGWVIYTIEDGRGIIFYSKKPRK